MRYPEVSLPLTSGISPFLLETALLSIFFSNQTAHALIICFHAFLTGFSFYYFFLHFTPKAQDNRFGRLCALIAGIAAVLNRYYILRGQYYLNIYFITAYLPFALVLLDKIMQAPLSPVTLRRLSAIGILTFLMVPGLSNLPATVAFMLMTVTFVTILEISRRKSMFALAAKLAAVTAIFFIFNAWWLYPNTLNKSVNQALTRSGTYMEETISSVEYQSDKPVTSYSSILGGRSYWIYEKVQAMTNLGINYVNKCWIHWNPLVIFLGFFPLALALLGVLHKKDMLDPPDLGMLGILVLFIPILALLRPPLGVLLSAMIKSLPIFVLRRPPTYMIILHLALAYLIGKALFNMFEGSRKKTTAIIAVIAILSTIGILNYQRLTGQKAYYNAHDFYRGQTKKITASFLPPDYFMDTITQLNNLPGMEGVLLLPLTFGVVTYDWTEEKGGYFGPSLYPFLVTRPTMSDFSDRDPISNFAPRINEAIYEGRTKELQNIMNILNLRYTVWQHDFCWNSENSKIIRNYSNSLETLRKTHSQSGVSGKHELFKNKGKLSPLFGTASQVRPIDVKSSEVLMDMLLENPAEPLVEIQDAPPGARFEPGLGVALLDNKKATQHEVALYFPPHNKGKKFLLTSKIFFSPFWSATDDTGKELKHTRINGFFNGWIVEGKGGPQTIHIVYTPQKTQDRLYIFTALILILALAAQWLIKPTRKLKTRTAPNA